MAYWQTVTFITLIYNLKLILLCCSSEIWLPLDQMDYAFEDGLYAERKGLSLNATLQFTRNFQQWPFFPDLIISFPHYNGYGSSRDTYVVLKFIGDCAGTSHVDKIFKLNANHEISKSQLKIPLEGGWFNLKIMTTEGSEKIIHGIYYIKIPCYGFDEVSHKTAQFWQTPVVVQLEPCIKLITIGFALFNDTQYAKYELDLIETRQRKVIKITDIVKDLEWHWATISCKDAPIDIDLMAMLQIQASSLKNQACPSARCNRIATGKFKLESQMCKHQGNKTSRGIYQHLTSMNKLSAVVISLMVVTLVLIINSVVFIIVLKGKALKKFGQKFKDKCPMKSDADSAREGFIILSCNRDPLQYAMGTTLCSLMQRNQNWNVDFRGEINVEDKCWEERSRDTVILISSGHCRLTSVKIESWLGAFLKTANNARMVVIFAGEHSEVLISSLIYSREEKETLHCDLEEFLVWLGWEQNNAQQLIKFEEFERLKEDVEIAIMKMKISNLLDSSSQIFTSNDSLPDNN